MKVVFLDIDGVLVTPRTMHAAHHKLVTCSQEERLAFCIDNAALNVIQRIQNNGWNLVLSSTWRIGKTLEDINEMFFPCGLSFVGKTGRHKTGIRGLEIEEWLEQNPVDDFIIIDDDNDMLPKQQGNLFLTHTQDGMTIDIIIKLLERCW